MKKNRDPFRMALVYAGPEQMAARRRASQEAPEPAPAPYPLNYAEGETEVSVTEFRDVYAGPETLEARDTICGAVYAGPDIPPTPAFPPTADPALFRAVYAGPPTLPMFQTIYAGPDSAPFLAPAAFPDLPEAADGGEEDTVQVTCPVCGEQYPARGSFCPSCGTPRPKEEP